MSTAREPWELSVVEVRDAIAAGDLSPREAVTSTLERIAAFEELVGAWEHVAAEGALREADEASPGSLRGVPAGIKDIFNTRDMPTTMGSPAWATFTPGNDARVVHYARRAGTVAIGKTVTAEFAVHTPGKTRNPHDLTRSPGTSSSGSAAAVACGMVPWALGSQTAGSIVRPASYVGVYGFKPSFGSIPRTGMLKTTDTLDQVGFFARTVDDLGPLFDVLRVHGPNYPLVHATLDQHLPQRFDDRPPRLGLVTDALATWDLATEEARSALLAYGDRLVAAGAEVESVALPASLADAHAIHEIIYDRCIACYFEREAQEKSLVSDVIRAMSERGRTITLEKYREALGRQAAMQRDFAAFAEGYDSFLTLSTAGPAPAFAEPDVPDSALIWTLCGAPVVSLPIFTTRNLLPFGAQLLAGRYRDYALLDLLVWLEERELAPRVQPVTPDAPEVALDERTAERHA